MIFVHDVREILGLLILVLGFSVAMVVVPVREPKSQVPLVVAGAFPTVNPVEHIALPVHNVFAP